MNRLCSVFTVNWLFFWYIFVSYLFLKSDYSLTNGEAGIETREKVFLLDWMETYKENQAKRGKKDKEQIKVTIRILKDYAGERIMMDQIDKAFCQEYIDYLLTEYRPKGKRVSNFTLHTYYRILNGALSAAIRAEIIKVNPFTKINNSDKIRLPESKRSYMTIEEVRALIAIPMKNEAVKQAYLFSCFCGLRISYIIGLKWKDVFIDRGQYTVWLFPCKRPKSRFICLFLPKR